MDYTRGSYYFQLQQISNCFHKHVAYAGGNAALQIAAKPLQIATWWLLTVYRNLPTPYPRYHRRPSTTYRLTTIQNVTDDRQTDRRQTDGRQVVPLARPSVW